MIHCGESKKDWKRLHERLRRVEYLPDSEIGAECGLEECSAVLVDEAHLLEPGARELLAGISSRRPVIFSGDCEDMTYLFVKSSVALNFTRTGTRSTGF